MIHKRNVCIIKFAPATGRFKVNPRLLQLLSILNAIKTVKRTFLISGYNFRLNDEKIVLIDITRKTKTRPTDSIFLRLINYLVYQILTLVAFLRISRRVHIVIFFQSESISTAIFCKLLNKKIIQYVGGSGFESLYYQVQAIKRLKRLLSKVLPYILLLAENIMCSLADKIVVVSNVAFEDQRINMYKSKTTLTTKFVATHFNLQKGIEKRENIVGFVGRFEAEKGILEFAEAISLVFDEMHVDKTKFLVIGDGSLKEEIALRLSRYASSDKVRLLRTLPHDEIPKYLNEMKLLVVPSHTEGLPSIVLEAMACGTPVLASPVGAIPDVVIEGKTGFLLKSTKPQHIAEKVVELVGNRGLLERVSEEAYKFVRKEFCFEKTLESWRSILKESNIHTRQ